MSANETTLHLNYNLNEFIKIPSKTLSDINSITRLVRDDNERSLEDIPVWN